MADVNGDGKVDIYVSGVDYLDMHGGNVLYINNGDGTFTDKTQEYGLLHNGFSTQAVFFDYDGDGDLDVYLLDHTTHERSALESKTGRLPEARAPATTYSETMATTSPMSRRPPACMMASMATDSVL